MVAGLPAKSDLAVWVRPAGTMVEFRHPLAEGRTSLSFSRGMDPSRCTDHHIQTLHPFRQYERIGDVQVTDLGNDVAKLHKKKLTPLQCVHSADIESWLAYKGQTDVHGVSSLLTSVAITYSRRRVRNFPQDLPLSYLKDFSRPFLNLHYST